LAQDITASDSTKRKNTVRYSLEDNGNTLIEDEKEETPVGNETNRWVLERKKNHVPKDDGIAPDSFNNHEPFRPLHSILELRIYIKDSGPETCRSIWTRQNAPQQRRRSAGITAFTAQRGKTGDFRRSQTDFNKVSRILQMSDDFGKSKPDICKCRAPFRKVRRHYEMLSAFLKRRPTIDKVGCKFRLWSDFPQSRLTF